MTPDQIAEATGIPRDVIELKFGVKRRLLPGPEDTTSSMGIRAARKALENSGTHPKAVDLLIWT
jgi:3-oxoacyl-[acyl-carrier-protein] synthase-3